MTVIHAHDTALLPYSRTDSPNITANNDYLIYLTGNYDIEENPVYSDDIWKTPIPLYHLDKYEFLVNNGYAGDSHTLLIRYTSEPAKAYTRYERGF